MFAKLLQQIARKLVLTHRDERGMMSLAFLVAVVFFMAFAGLVYNAGNTINRKIETQNAADAVAYSGSLWVARGMNAITAANHVMGELNALHVLHHALGGTRLDRGGGPYNHSTLNTLNGVIEGFYRGCTGAPVPAIPPNMVKRNTKADYRSTLFDAKLTLKGWATGAYSAHAIAYGVYLADPTGIGKAAALVAMGVAAVLEAKVAQEYAVLEGVEAAAKVISPFKKQLPTFIKMIDHYTSLVRTTIPIQAMNSAEQIASRHKAKGMIRGDFPDSLSGIAEFAPLLPIQRERAVGNVNAREERRSQMLRATYPWVVHWRYRPIQFFKWTCTLSLAAKFYRDYTEDFALQSSVWMRTTQTYRNSLTVVNFNAEQQSGSGTGGKGVRMFVMKGLDQPRIEKSEEIWNQRRGQTRRAIEEAENLFTHMGFAWRSPHAIGAPAFYRQENPDGHFAFAQSMIYNANPQQQPTPARGAGQRQANVGWDTLNWIDGPAIVEYKSGRDEEASPKIRLNWQAKLTPVTPEKLTKTAVSLHPEMSAILLRAREGLLLTNH